MFISRTRKLIPRLPDTRGQPMKTITEKEWCVRFIGDYFSLITNVTAENEEQAEATAIWQLKDYHGLDMEEAGAWQVEVFDEDGEEL